MVAATLTLSPGVVRTVHWPLWAGVDAMQLRICRAFRRSWRKVLVVVTHQGRELFEFEKPWIFCARRESVELDVRFERRSDEEIEELMRLRDDEGDESDGFSTPSEIEEAMDHIGF